jgi:hypothetical protein
VSFEAHLVTVCFQRYPALVSLEPYSLECLRESFVFRIEVTLRNYRCLSDTPLCAENAPTQTLCLQRLARSYKLRPASGVRYCQKTEAALSFLAFLRRLL